MSRVPTVFLPDAPATSAFFLLYQTFAGLLIMRSMIDESEASHMEAEIRPVQWKREHYDHQIKVTVARKELLDHTNTKKNYWIGEFNLPGDEWARFEIILDSFQGQGPRDTPLTRVQQFTELAAAYEQTRSDYYQKRKDHGEEIMFSPELTSAVARLLTNNVSCVFNHASAFTGWPYYGITQQPYFRKGCVAFYEYMQKLADSTLPTHKPETRSPICDFAQYLAGRND